jgi:hypothetical protein
MINELRKLRGDHKIFALSLGFLFAICYLLFASTALAQEATRTYTIAPPTITQELNPGQNVEGILKVINNTDYDLTFTVSIKDFIVEDTAGTPKFLPNNTLSNKYSAASWIGVTPSVFTIKSQQKQELNYYIRVPISARPGGHYAAVIYTPSTNLEVTGTGATVSTEAGSLFYITVNGPIIENSLVSKFFVNPFQEYGPVKILTRIKNLGDLHIAPKATINVSGFFYNKSQDLDTHNIFPEAARDFENTFGQTLMIGRYRAVLLGSYGANNNMPLAASVYFWVFPWRIAIVIVLAIIALLLAALYLRKRKKSVHKVNEEATTEAITPLTEEVK